MSGTVIYIGEEALDLSPGTVVATTFQVWDIGDLKIRNTTFTNKFKIPKTENNIRIFEHANQIKSLSTKPYRKLPCNVTHNGIEIIPDGTAVLNDSEDIFNITIFSGTFDFFEAIKDQYLNSLDYSAFDSVGAWSKAVADGWRNTTSGIVAPVLQYGVNLRDSGGTIFNTLTVGGIEYSLPSFYYHTILDKIITEAGYEYEGTVFSDDKFLKLIVPAGNSTNPGNYSSAYYDARNASASAVGGQTIVNPPVFPTPAIQVEFTNVTYNGSKGYYNGVDAYQRDGSQNDNFMINVYVWLDITVTGGTVRLDITGNGTSIQGISSSAGTGVYEASFNISADTLALQALGVGVSRDVNPATCVINNAVFRIKTSGSPFTQYGITWSNDKVQIYSEVLPEMEKAEFIKDFLIRFGQLVKEKQGILYFKGIDEIIADRAGAVDWTEKRDVSKPEKLSFLTSGIGQLNTYEYDVTSDTLTDNYTGRGEFTVDNENLPDLEDYVSPFASSQTAGNNARIFSSTVKVWDDTTDSDYDHDPGFRLLAVRDKVSTEPAVTWDSVARTDYKVAYFADPRFGTCSYQSFLDAYYTRYIASIQKLKIIQRYYTLTEIDIINLDLFKLVLDDGDYFMIRKIDNFVPGRSTKVELFKVN